MKIVAKILTGALLLFASAGSVLCQGTLDARRDEGIRALSSGDYATAERIFSDLHRQGASGEIATDLALAEAGEHHFDQAIAHFHEAIRLGNDAAPVHYNLGVVYLDAGHDEDGILELRAATTKDPRFLPAQRALGMALLNANQPGEAVRCLEQARNLAPQDEETWIALDRAEFEAKNPSAALATVDQAIKSIPANPRFVVALADVCARHGQLQKARDILEESMDVMPGNPQIELALARVSLQAGEPMEALAALKDVPPDAGLPGEAMYLRGEARILTKDYVVADVDFTGAIQADPANPRYLVAYARLQQVEGDYGKALATLNKASELKPALPEIPFRMAVSYYYQTLWTQAQHSCEAAIELQPGYILAYLLLGATKFRLNDIMGAQDAFRHVVAERPNIPFFHVALAVALFRGDCLEASLKELDRALAIDPQAAVAHYYRARVLSRQKEPQNAIAELETAVALQPHYREAYAELARLYAAQGQQEKARDAMAKHAAEVQTEQAENKRMQEEIRDSADDIDNVLKLSEIVKSR